MVTTDISQWDETICNMIACQHPPCWEAMRRIEKGQPRILVKNLNSLQRDSPETEDELPSLKIFNFPFNYSSRESKHAKSSSSIIRDSNNYSTSQVMIEGFGPSVSELSYEKNHFPGLNSRMEPHSPYFPPISLTALRQVEKIQVTDLSDLAAPMYGNLIVRWIPDVRHKLLQNERPSARTQTPTLRMCVKELALENLLSFKNSNETKRKKSSKVPTGGQPYLWHLRNPRFPANKSSTTDRERKAVESPAGKRKIFPQHLHLSPLADEQKKNAAHEEKKKSVFPGIHEFPFIVQKVPVKERILGRLQSQLQIPFEGSGIPKHLVLPLAQQLNGTTLTFQNPQDCGQRSERKRWLCKTFLHQEASSEKVHLPLCGPQISQMAIKRRKPSLKFVEYKSNRASLFLEGYDSSVHRVSKSESKHQQYCNQIAVRKEVALPQSSSSSDRKLWLKEAAQKSEENLLQSPNPAPPPPSPLVSECSDTSSQYLAQI